jgi:hypothetical protein
MSQYIPNFCSENLRLISLWKHYYRYTVNIKIFLYTIFIDFHFDINCFGRTEQTLENNLSSYYDIFFVQLDNNF